MTQSKSLTSLSRLSEVVLLRSKQYRTKAEINSECKLYFRKRKAVEIGNVRINHKLITYAR